MSSSLMPDNDLRLPILIDTDCGVDDAQALIAVLKDQQQTNVIAITTVSGNTNLEQATMNVCACLEVADRPDIPVYKGCSRPLIEPFRNADTWHGNDGLGGTNLGELSNKSPIQEESAILAIIRIAKEWAIKKRRITLITLGPLTNIAIAFRLDPNLSNYIEKIIIMGGTYKSIGNVTLCAEYNAHSDPEAFAIVLEGFPTIQLITWELTLHNGLSTFFCKRWFNEKTGAGNFLKKISKHLQDVTKNHSELSEEEYEQKGFYIPDPLCMSIACRPECILTSSKRRVIVELNNGHTRGMTIVDHKTKGVDKSALNVEIIETINMQMVEAFLLSSTK